MQNMPQLSIIVPIYNGELFLNRCIDSILAQTFSNFELLLIDDGSVDRSFEIIEEYARKDKRIVAVHQDNQGVSCARNRALGIARGEYIGFVDADDYIEPEMFELMIKKIQKTKSDIVCCSWTHVLPDGTKTKHRIDINKEEMSAEEFLQHLFDEPRSIGSGPYNKMFKKAFINWPFDERLKICEDLLFIVQNGKSMLKACLVSESLYNVYENPNSTIRQNYGKATRGLPVRRRVIDELRSVSEEARQLAERDYLATCVYLANGKKNSEEKYYKFAATEFKTYFENNRQFLLTNKTISWKTKIVYIKEYFILMMRDIICRKKEF